MVRTIKVVSLTRSLLNLCVVAGTAILSKQKALSVDYTLPGHPDPKYVKGRIITLEFENTYLIGTYVPNAGTGLKVQKTAES